MFSGLRGAIAFALAIRNATTEAQNVILSTTSLIVIVTVIVCGGMTSPMLGILRIKTGEDASARDSAPSDVATRNGSISQSVKSAPNYNTLSEDVTSTSTSPPAKLNYRKSWFHKRFGNFDVRFLKPLLTHSKPSLEETCCVGGCCAPLARCLTSDQQRNHGIQSLDEEDATSWETRRGETPMQDFRSQGGGGGGEGAAQDFSNMVVDNQTTQLIEEDENEGLEAANIIIDKDNNVKY